MRRVTLTVIALLSVVGAGCGGDSNTLTFDEPNAGFTFSYPKGFAGGFTAVGREIEGRPPAFTGNVGLDEVNVLVVSTYMLKRPIDPTTDRPFIDGTVRGIARATQMTIGKSAAEKLGDLAAFAYDLDATDGSTHSRLILGFKDRTEYFLRCNWDADGANKIPDACREAQRSFKLTG